MCGSDLPASGYPINLESGEVELTMVSDAWIESQGFSLSYQTIPVQDIQGTCISTNQHTLVGDGPGTTCIEYMSH